MKGNLDGVLADCNKAIELKPDYADAHCHRGSALLLLDRNEQADQSFDLALSIQPRHLQAMAGKGLVSLHLRHSDAALAAFNAALTIKPDVVPVPADRARPR